MNKNLSWSRSLLGLMMSAGLGCSDPQIEPSSVPAGGVVNYNGQPLEGALVSFISTDLRQGRSASGLTDDKGTFQLKSYLPGGKQADGAVPGEYKVSIRKRAPPEPADGAEVNAATGKTAPPASSDEPQTSADSAESSHSKASGSADTGTPEGPPAQSASPPSARMGGPGTGGMPGRPGGGVTEGKSLIPEKYGNPDESGLTAILKQEGNDSFRFDLTDE